MNLDNEQIPHIASYVWTFGPVWFYQNNFDL